jgi:hypothetical protein
MQSNESMGGLLGGLGGMAAGMAKLGVFSDRRLKSDVQRIGVDERTGLPLYEFAYTAEPGRRYVGVMADEVRERFPEAVLLDESGFMRVDYAALGIEFKEVK